MTAPTQASKMSAWTRAQMGIMAGVMASVVMGVAIIVITTLGLWVGAPWPIQFYPWVGAIFGAVGLPVSIAEAGVAWFVALSIFAGLVFAFGYENRTYDIYEGMVMGGVALLLVGLYMTVEVAPQLSGTILTMSLYSSLAVLLPLALCFGLWGLTIGYFGEKYLA